MAVFSLKSALPPVPEAAASLVEEVDCHDLKTLRVPRPFYC